MSERKSLVEVVDAVLERFQDRLESASRNVLVVRQEGKAIGANPLLDPMWYRDSHRRLSEAYLSLMEATELLSSTMGVMAVLSLETADGEGV